MSRSTAANLLKRTRDVMETAQVNRAVLEEDGFPSEAAVEELHHGIRSSPLVRRLRLRLEPGLGRRRRRRRRPPSLRLRHRGRRRAPAGVRGAPGVGAEVDDGGRRRSPLLLPRGGRAPARVLPVVGDLVRRGLLLRPLHPPRRVASLVLVRAAVVEPAGVRRGGSAVSRLPRRRNGTD